jgi:hypothetical protein
MEEEKKENVAEDFVAGADKVQTRQPQIITVGGKTYKIKQIRKFARYWIDKLNREAWWCEQQSKKAISLKQSHRISKRLNTLHAKTAALYLLGLKALIPFVFAFTWRRLMLKHDEVIATINLAGYSGDAQVNFSLTNWDITKLQLARSTNLIGSGLKELEQRMQNAKAQAEADATPKKEAKK